MTAPSRLCNRCGAAVQGPAPGGALDEAQAGSCRLEQARTTIETTAGKHRFEVATTSGTSHRRPKQRLEQAPGAIVRA
jgi:hypothetical protein